MVGKREGRIAYAFFSLEFVDDTLVVYEGVIGQLVEDLKLAAFIQF